MLIGGTTSKAGPRHLIIITKTKTLQLLSKIHSRLLASCLPTTRAQAESQTEHGVEQRGSAEKIGDEDQWCGESWFKGCGGGEETGRSTSQVGDKIDILFQFNYLMEYK